MRHYGLGCHTVCYHPGGHKHCGSEEIMILVVQEQNSTSLLKSAKAQHKSFFASLSRKSNEKEKKKKKAISRKSIVNLFALRTLQVLKIQICMKIFLESTIRPDHKMDYNSFTSIHPIKFTTLN